MPPKKGKAIKLKEAVEESSDDDAKESDQELHKQLEQDLSLLIIETGSGANTGKKRKRNLTYPPIRVGLSSNDVDEIEKLEGNLRPIETMNKLLIQQFECNRQFTSERPQFQKYLQSFQKQLKTYVASEKQRRIELDDGADKDYVRPQKDEYELRKEQAMLSLMRQVVKITKKKNKSQDRNNHGRASRKKLQKTEEAEISGSIIRIIERIGLRVNDYQLQDKIRAFERKISQKFIFGIKFRSKSLAQTEDLMSEIVEKIERLDQTIKELIDKTGQLMMYKNKQKSIAYSLFDVGMPWIIQNDANFENKV